MELDRQGDESTKTNPGHDSGRHLDKDRNAFWLIDGEIFPKPARELWPHLIVIAARTECR